MSVAILYAGQGSQHPGMGADLYQAYPEFAQAFEAANLDFDLKELCFQDPYSDLNKTKYTQPAMVAFACGVTAILKKMGIQPDYVAGLSLGEYSALEASGVFDAKTAIETVAFRGKAMTKASEGLDCAMAAVLELPEDELQRCCDKSLSHGYVSICNYNCVGQLVIGGEKSAVDYCCQLAMESGARRTIPLKVSGPFHTVFMAPAGDNLEEYFKTVDFMAPQTPVVFNTLGTENNTDMTIPDLLVRQVKSPVRMDQSINYMLDHGVDTFIEVGPGHALTGFVKKTVRNRKMSGIRTFVVETAEDVAALKEAI